MELGRDYKVPRRSSGAAVAIFMLLVLGTGLLVAAIALPLLGGDALHRYWWVLLLLPVAAAGLYPPVLNRGLATLLRLARREPMPNPLSLPGVLRAVGWGLAMWLLYGIHVWVLARMLGAGGVGLLPRSIGAFAAAWCVGFLVVIAPAGGGAREAALIVVHHRRSRLGRSGGADGTAPAALARAGAGVGRLARPGDRQSGSSAQMVVQGNGVVTWRTVPTLDTRRSKPRFDQWLRCPGVLPRSFT